MVKIAILSHGLIHNTKVILSQKNRVHFGVPCAFIEYGSR